MDVGEAELLRQRVVGGGNGAVFVFVVVEQIHFVDGDDDVRAAQVMQDGAVPLGLWQQLQRRLAVIELRGVE